MNQPSPVARVRDVFRTQLWPAPTVGVLLAIGLGVGLPRLDATVADRLPAPLTAYLFGGGADAARAVLEAIAGSLITVTSLTFSLTVVTLQLASSQFSPRLLRTFARDRFVHITLALFLATFTYALTVLRTVRARGGSEAEFVPQFSVTLAYVLALTSVLMLVLFLAHLTEEIRVETMLRNVHRDASDTVRSVLPELEGSAPEEAPQPPPDATVLPAGSSGFFVHLNERQLFSAAVEADAVVVIDRPVGSSLIAGTPVACAWPRGGGSLPRTVTEELTRRLAAAIKTGKERTASQDIAFGLRQLTDVATKALSPGINDPTTAVHALGHCSALLCELARHDLSTRVFRDEEGQARVMLRQPGLEDLLEIAVGQPRRYGAADPVVLARITAMLYELAWSLDRSEQRSLVAAQLARLRSTVAAQAFDHSERDRLAQLAEQVDDELRARPGRHGSPA